MVNWFYLTSTVVLSISSATAAGVRPGQIKNLVTFGDSFTDTFWIANGGQNQWPTYATRYSKTNLYPYARSGGTCSNELTPRPFPSVFESQLPTYYDAVKGGAIKVRPDETLYSLWIGTNDVGANALLTESKSNIVEVSDCMINWVKVLYQRGARNFLFQNVSANVTIFEVGTYILVQIDGSTRDHTHVLSQRLSHQVLDCGQERHAVVQLHQRAGGFQQ